MSTKIYYAWRIEGLKTIAQIHRLGRKTMAPAVKAIVKDNLRQMIDGSSLTPKELRQEYTKRFVFQKDEQLKHLYSPKIEMTFYPSRRGVMLIPFCEGSLHDYSIRKYLDELEGCIPWGYWNNSDKPEEISRREWRLRRDDWEGLFDEPMIPTFGEVGLTMTLHTQYQPWADQIWPPSEYPEMWADVDLAPKPQSDQKPEGQSDE